MIAIFGLRRETGAPPGTPVLPAETEVSAATPELAARTVDRLQLFRAGNGGARMSLSADELTALLRHAMPGVLPAGVDDASVRLRAGVVVVEARVATADFVARAPLAAVMGALPDTLQVGLRGRLATSGDRLLLHVESAHASGVPLPAGAVAAIAASLAEQGGGRVLPGDGKDASLGLRRPDGLALVAVVGDRIVLDRDERMGDRAVDGSDDP